jgi:hypothetical protein
MVVVWCLGVLVVLVVGSWGHGFLEWVDMGWVDYTHVIARALLAARVAAPRFAAADRLALRAAS